MPGSTPRWGLPYPLGSETADGDASFLALANALDNHAQDSSGTFAARPVSTPGSPGKAGRYYFATDQRIVYRDNGTGWDPCLPTDMLGINSESAVRRGKSIIPGEESRTNTAFGLMPTPDRVQSIVLATDGLIIIRAQFMMKESVSNTARAAIFIGANQLKYASPGQAAPVVSETSQSNSAGQNQYLLIASYQNGLAPGYYFETDGSPGSNAYTGDVTTGQALGAPSLVLINNPQTITGYNQSGNGGTEIAVEAAAGTYDISIQFKSTSGSVTVKERKLWVESKAY